MHTALAQLAGAADPLVPVVWSVQEWANQDMSLIQVGALLKPSESTQIRINVSRRAFGYETCRCAHEAWEVRLLGRLLCTGVRVTDFALTRHGMRS